MKKLVVLDYGSGNLRSAERALARVGAEVTVTADFEAALTETRASVTPEMLEEYQRIQETLKSEAVRPDGGIGFVLPGTLQPRRNKPEP